MKLIFEISQNLGRGRFQRVVLATSQLPPQQPLLWPQPLPQPLRYRLPSQRQSLGEY